MDAGELPELDQSADDGFVDLSFRIQETTLYADGARDLVCVARHGGQRVGLRVSIQPGMKPGLRPGTGELAPGAVCRGGISFSSVGAESDALLQAIGSLYRRSAGQRFVERIGFTVIALQGDPGDMDREDIRFKLFGNDERAEDDYFESFLNVSLGRRLVSWNEKDADYRVALLKGIGG